MKDRTIVVLVVVGTVLFFLAPVVYVTPTVTCHSFSCPNISPPHYASLSRVILGFGATYDKYDGYCVTMQCSGY